MSKRQTIAFYNDTQAPLDELMVPVNDRAYVFGDAVYEVLRVYGGQPFLLDMHLARLWASLDAIGITGVKNIEQKIVENIRVNDIEDGSIYVQVSRGTAPRVHSYNGLPLKPNLLVTSTIFTSHPAQIDAETGIFAITHDDLRWGLRHIKSVNLLPNCLAQTKANQQGAKEAILIRDHRYVTEASSANIFLVKDSQVVTARQDRFILAGTRRRFLIDAFKNRGISMIERDIDKSELLSADEIFISSTIKEAIGVTKVDDQPVGDGRVGPMAKLARQLIINAAMESQ